MTIKFLMKFLVMAQLCLAPAMAQNSADPCAEFASFFAFKAVTASFLLGDSGQSQEVKIYDFNFLPDTPSLENQFINNEGSLVKDFSSVITAVLKSDPFVATRYYVSLQVEDHDASCALIEDSVEVELEN